MKGFGVGDTAGWSTGGVEIHGVDRFKEENMNERTTTLDVAQDKFRADPSEINGQRYLETVLHYWRDGMVGIKTYMAASKEVAEYLTKPRGKRS